MQELPDQPTKQQTPEQPAESEQSVPGLIAGSGKKSKKLLLLVAFIVVTLAGVLTYLFVSAPDLLPWNLLNSSTQPSKSKQSDAPTAKSIVTMAAKRMNSDPVEIAESTSVNGKDADGNIVYTAAYHRLDDREFSVPPDELFGASSSGTAESTAEDALVLLAFLKANGFSTLDSHTGQSGDAIVAQTTLISSRAVCHISNLALTNIFVAGIGCAELSSYRKVAQNVQPLYDAFAESNPAQAKDLYIDEPEITDGEDGYERATAVMVNFTALFYRVPDGGWKYFMSMQQNPDCFAFDTEDLRKAFSGFACFNYATLKNSKV